MTSINNDNNEPINLLGEEQVSTSPSKTDIEKKKKKKLWKSRKGRNPFKLVKKQHKPRWDVYPVIELNNHEANFAKGYPSNKITTTKYTPITFIPKNLFEQFRRLTNFYFLLITALTLVPQISPLTPITSILPLVFVLGVTLIKDGFEDYRRYQADSKVNNRAYKILRPNGETETVKSKDLKVGDIILIQDKESFPADLILITSSLEDGVCFVETSQLDGESNLKMLRAIRETSAITQEEVRTLNAKIACEAPHHNLYVFNANITIGDKVYSIDEKQLLLRGAGLRNTPWAIGIIAYSGVDTKLSLNQRSPPSKFSTIEKRMNRIVLAIFTLSVIFSAIAAIGAGAYQSVTGSGMWYIGSYQDVNPGSIGALSFASYFVLLSFLIPMSMMVTLEVVKVVQAYWMEWDVRMMTDPNDPDSGMSAKTSNLNDELGLVKYIFSDKTGTLTQNKMEFARCSINGISYSNPAGGELAEYLKGQNWSPKLELSEEDAEIVGPMVEYLRVLALCQNVVPEMVDGKLTYQAQSPDEAALCNAARVNEFVFLSRRTSTITITEMGVERVYGLLNVLEFSSDRARMTVIVRSPEGKIIVYSKGADSRMLPLLRDDTDSGLKRKTREHIDTFSKEGLRTLIVAKRELSSDEYEEWNMEYSKANSAIVDRSTAVASVCETIERKLTLLGCTAIEDKLQDGVPDTIKYLLEAGIRVWIITGDKQETAINIGYSTNLLKKNMPLVKINASTDDECKSLLTDAITGHVGLSPEIGLVIDGASLIFAIANHKELLLKLSTIASSVVCCRVTPLQKAQIVTLVKESSKDTCLAIGDGANDVSMIQAAHIGIGIYGKEGTQAARASDYAIQQFSHLRVLIAHHGRYSLKRNAGMIQMSFYKNMAFFLTQFWFAFWNGYTAQTLYDDYITTAYNIVITSAPPFFFAIFEKDISEAVIDRYPQVYKLTQTCNVFTYRTLALWLVSALYHSLIFFYGIFFLYRDGGVFSNGQVGDLWTLSITTSTFAFLVVLNKMALETGYWTIGNQLAYWGSILVYIVLVLILSNMPSYWPSFYYSLWKVAPSADFWLMIIIVFVICLIPDVVFKYLKRMYRPEDWQILQEKQRVDYSFHLEEAVSIERRKNEEEDSIEAYENIKL